MHYLFPVIGYLIGSVSAAILVCEVAGLPDPRTQGSGNPGATNVLRVGGKGPAAITLLGDAAKGLIPVLAAMLIGIPPLWVGLTALAAVLGHLFPVFFQFRGGKGVATSFGAIFGISWLAGLLTIATWLAISLTFRYSSLAALTSMVLVPLYLWITTRSMALAVCGALIGVLIFWRHRANITRLLNGTEPKIGDKTKS
jgi:glycerol-3-phosphate acyltransferase PlsY